MSAQACRLADRWGATICLDLCFTTLSKVIKDEELCKELDGVLALLPDSISVLPEYAAWVKRQARLKSAMDTAAVPLDQFFDVHALITSTEALQLFHQLSFVDVLSWVGSEQLVVDSEDSVAVAIGVWTHGRTCSDERLIQLCSLLRVRHLSTGALPLICPSLCPACHNCFLVCMQRTYLEPQRRISSRLRGGLGAPQQVGNGLMLAHSLMPQKPLQVTSHHSGLHQRASSLALQCLPSARPSHGTSHSATYWGRCKGVRRQSLPHSLFTARAQGYSSA
jgi:hypothetical protein